MRWPARDELRARLRSASPGTRHGRHLVVDDIRRMRSPRTTRREDADEGVAQRDPEPGEPEPPADLSGEPMKRKREYAAA